MKRTKKEGKCAEDDPIFLLPLRILIKLGFEVARSFHWRLGYIHLLMAYFGI